MFCNKCGSALQPDDKICAKCGTPVAGGVITPAPTPIPSIVPAQSRLARHLRTLGVLWIVVGALWLVPSMALFILGRNPHFMMPSGTFWGPVFGPSFMFGLGLIFLIVAAAGICVGWGLIEYQPWARMVAIVLGVLALVRPPFGTVLGIYTLWVLLARGADVEFERMARRG
jgi:zinc-ribbon domain